jgi:formylglycine-generating enzyme required for sulfatase activity
LQDGRASAQSANVTAGDLQTGARIGRYVVIESVGSGAMGVVYGAYDPQLDRKVALKLLKPGQGATERAKARLLREAQAMARLSHPNVVAVHDVGVFEDQVFLAMEFLAAGTIKSWLADKPRSWREILGVFAAAGRGLAAAHAAGLVHRDFKPDNVLLDKEGRPRVVDFGIARQAEGTGDDDVDSQPGRDPVDVAKSLRESSGNVAPLLTLTKTGAMVGTPAYMSPEQFMGERGDDKSDQFSFCVALYEALYGERPFAGNDVISISVNVTQGELRPLPKDRGVPAWIRRVILRGVKADPAARWPSMTALIAALEDDPAVRLRRRLVAGGTIAAVAAALLVARQMVARRRLEADREITRHVVMAESAIKAARSKVAAAKELRRRAFVAFDKRVKQEGEALWRQERSLVPPADADYDRGERAFETAFVLDQSRSELRARLADLRVEHLLFAEEARLESKVEVLRERISSIDADGSKQRWLAAPGTLALRTTPVASRLLLERYDRDAATGRRIGTAIGSIPPSRTTTTLEPGSYRVLLDGPGLAHVVYPFELRRGERIAADLRLPSAASVPEGFVYVPEGDSWFGDGDEQLRTQFLDTVPLHRRHVDSFLIARHETTYAEWIPFLDSLASPERERRAPDVSTAARGSLRLSRSHGGAWELAFQPSTRRYAAEAGQSVVYEGRDRQIRQDWLQFPVTGISPADVDRYLGWLRSSGRLPGARLCTEVEWERAARGADERVFPHGDDLQPQDANFDLTYGRVPSAYGPDVVGSHPASRSPFDVDDLAGNALEYVASSEEPDALVIRGGGYYFGAASCRSTNRESVPSVFRDVVTGIRVCASLKGEP